MSRELERWIRGWPLFVWGVSIVVVPLFVIGVVVWSVCTRQDSIAAIGLSLSVVVAHVATIRPFLEKPRLRLFIDDVRCYPATMQNDTASWFIRLGIANYGLRPARDCVGRVFEVWTAQGERLMKFDPLTLFWARQDNEHTRFSPVTIQGGGDFEYLDVAQVKRGATPLKLRVVMPPPMTLTRWPDNDPSPGIEAVLRSGTYYLLIGIQAADASIRRLWFEIVCSEAVPDSCCDNVPCQIQKKTPRFARR